MGLFFVHFGIKSYVTYTINDISFDHFEIVHKSYGLTHRMNAIWVTLNVNHNDLETLTLIRGPFEDLEREMERKILQVFRTTFDYPPDLKHFLIEFLLGDLCPLTNQPENCSLNLFGT
jgi:hypothetical protein